MATVSNFNQDEENKGTAQATQPGAVQQLSSNAGQASSGGSTPAPAGSAPARRQEPSSKPNIRQYMNANQGVGNQISQNIQNNFQNKANQFGDQVNTSRNQVDSTINPLQQNLGAQGQSTIQSAFQDPKKLLDAYNAAKTDGSQLSQDQQSAYNQYNQFQKLNTGGYNNDIDQIGAQTQQTNAQLGSQLQNLQKTANSANTESGRFQLLQNTINRPNYTTGQQSLDSLFLQTQPGATQNLQKNLQSASNTAAQNVNSFGQDAEQKLAALRGLASDRQAEIKSTFGSGLKDINTNLQQKYQQTAASLPQVQQQLIDAAKNNEGNEQLINLYKQAGLDPNMQTYGADISDRLIKQNLATGAEGLAQVATPEEFARYNALNQLAGNNAPLQSSIFGSAQTAGGFNPLSVDAAGVKEAAAAKKQQLDEAFRNSMQQIATWNQGDGGWDSRLTGAKTPEDARNTVAEFSKYLKNRYGTSDQIINHAINPFNNFYNNVYNPAISKRLAGNVSGTSNVNPYQSRTADSPVFTPAGKDASTVEPNLFPTKK
jgi:ElaB/YqjD/DUF883 family membrane-anchored ribosome-binding protein